MPDTTQPATAPPATAQPDTRRAEVLAATPSLFTPAGELDEAANAALFEHLAGRVDGVFVAGTTGEFPALHDAERLRLAELALATFGADHVVVHVGAASTRDAVALTEAAVALGARRLATLTPYYLPADTEAVRRHFAAVTGAAGGAAVYGYLFPDRSGIDLTPADFADVVASTGLAGAKLSGAAAARFAEYRAALPPSTRLWSGADTTLASVVRGGGSGIVSGLSAAFPGPFTALADALAAGDADAERAAQATADEVFAALGGTVEGIKLAVHLLGRGGAGTRMPHPEVPAEARERIAALATR
ncbi:MAG TPA: dihydrodipicolinate synthase family protein [Pseudonocardia sp.]|jgi:4-hydroxy-tetrahydrodipicolinate synthase|nr:dihydrodipicolinate synthase family protein [Pseudonocardia sp.]